LNNAAIMLPASNRCDIVHASVAIDIPPIASFKQQRLHFSETIKV